MLKRYRFIYVDREEQDCKTNETHREGQFLLVSKTIEENGKNI